MLFTFLLAILNSLAADGYSCLGYPRVYNATITQHILLYKDALPAESSREKLYRDMIRQQVIHTFPNMQLFQADKSLVLGSYDMLKMKKTILSVEDAPLPFDLYIPPMSAPEYFIPETREYIKNVFALKKISKGDKMVKVTYQLEMPVELCQKENKDLTTLLLPHPLEPLFTYFQVDPNRKITREILGIEKIKVNPCSTRPLIETNNEEAFWGMWYFWNPFQTNSPEEEAFDCRTYYQQDVHWKYADVKLTLIPVAKKTPSLEGLREKKKLKMSFIFNSFKAKSFKKMEGDLPKTIEETYKKILGKIEFIQAKNLMVEKFKGQDDSLAMIGIFLFNLSHNALLKGVKFEIKPYHFKIKLEGILKLSAKPFEMVIFLSTNKPEHESYVPFNEEVARSLIEDDVVTITTHSVFGVALDLAMKKSREQANNPNRPSYQFVALLSCLGKSYFPPGALPLPPKGKTVDYVHSLTTLTESHGVGVLTMIGMVDHAMRFGQAPPFESWLKNTRYNNFISFENVTGQ